MAGLSSLQRTDPSSLPCPCPSPQDPACAASLTRVAAQASGTPDEELFADFVGAVLNDLVYLLKDSLGVGVLGWGWGGQREGWKDLEGPAVALGCVGATALLLGLHGVPDTSTEGP